MSVSLQCRKNRLLCMDKSMWTPLSIYFWPCAVIIWSIITDYLVQAASVYSSQVLILQHIIFI